MWNLATDPRSLPFNYSTEGSQIGACLAVPWKVCQTQMAGPRVPDLADFMSSEFLFQTSLMLLLKGPQRPQFKNFCPMPKGLSHRGWNRGRKEITMTVDSKKRRKILKKVGMELRKKGAKHLVIVVKLKSYVFSGLLLPWWANSFLGTLNSLKQLWAPYTFSGKGVFPCSGTPYSTYHHKSYPSTIQCLKFLY